jgi:hypothetical protein
MFGIPYIFIPSLSFSKTPAKMVATVTVVGLKSTYTNPICVAVPEEARTSTSIEIVAGIFVTISREALLKGRLSTVDLLVLTSQDNLF